MFQGAITVTTYILAIFLRNFVTLVLDVIGGVAGLSLLYIIPGVSLLKMRSKFEKEMMPLDVTILKVSFSLTSCIGPPSTTRSSCTSASASASS